ncbi:unnamed protein product, partial [Polarella glacialis]
VLQIHGVKAGDLRSMASEGSNQAQEKARLEISAQGNEDRVQPFGLPHRDLDLPPPSNPDVQGTPRKEGRAVGRSCDVDLSHSGARLMRGVPAPDMSFWADREWSG